MMTFILFLLLQNWPTTSVLDDFNRANGALGANWSEEGFTACTISSNTVTGTADEDINLAVWQGATFSDCEAWISYVTLADEGLDGSGIQLTVRFDSGTLDGYFVGWDEVSNTIDFGTVSGGSFSGYPTAFSFDTGDALMLRAVGNQISWYHSDEGAEFVLQDTETDGTYTSGDIGFWVNDQTIRVDNFGGGEYIPPPVLIF